MLLLEMGIWKEYKSIIIIGEITTCQTLSGGKTQGHHFTPVQYTKYQVNNDIQNSYENS